MYLIDADEFFKNLTEYAPPEMTWNAGDIAHKLDEMPRINTEPVRHGKWIVQKVDANQTKFYCSECERCVLCGNDYFMKPTKHIAYFYPYCHCGAKMDKGVQNDQN